MKKKALKLFGILFSSLAIVISSCGKSGADSSSSRAPSGEDIFDKVDLGEGVDASLSEEEIYYNSNQDYDVGPDYKVKVAIQENTDSLLSNSLKTDLLDNTNTTDLITIKDHHGNSFYPNVKSCRDEQGKEYFEITPTSEEYREGTVITASLHDDRLCFKDKNPEFDDLYFNIPREETNFFNISEKVPFFDINKVVYFPVADDEYKPVDDPNSDEAKEYFDNATFHFGYREQINLNVDEQFGVCIIRGSTKDISNPNTFYGRFVSCIEDNGAYKITFKQADLSKIFVDENTGDLALDMHLEDEAPTLKNIALLANEKNYRKAFTKCPDFMNLCAAIAEVTDNSLTDILSKLSFSFNCSGNGSAVYIQISVGALIPFGKSGNQAVRIELMFQWAISFAGRGDVQLKKILKIPYWISVYGEVSKTTDFTFKFKIGWSRKFNKEEDDKDIQERIANAAQEIKNDPHYFSDRTDDDVAVTSNKISVPLLTLAIPIAGIFSFEVDLTFDFTLDLNVLFEYGYKSHTVEKILSFSTDGGVSNTTNTTQQSATTHSFQLGGTLYVSIGLSLSASFGVVGLRSLFGITLSVSAGIYLQAKAMGGISFGSQQATTFYGTVDLEIGFFANLSARLQFLFIFDFSFTFAMVKVPFLQLNSPVSIMEMFAPNELLLTSYNTDIADTKLLTVKAFNTTNFEVNDITYRTNSTVNTIDGPVTPLTILPWDNRIIIDTNNNTIKVSPDAPAYFETTLTVKMHDSLDNWQSTTKEKEKKVQVTFKSATAKNISFGKDGEFKTLVEKGKQFRLPNPVVDKSLTETTSFSTVGYDGNGGVSFNFNYNDYVYDFLSYSDGKRNYAPGDLFTMPDEDVVLKVNLYKIVYYQVYFRDGRNKLIKQYEVREKTASPEPTEAERAMEGYYFIGWDRAFNYVTEDMDVYGIYVKGGSSL